MPIQTIDLALAAPVRATDGPVGRVERVIVNPETGRATHLVVREDALPNTQRLIAEKYIAEAHPEGVTLRLSRKQVAERREYIQSDYYPPSFFLGLAKTEHAKLPLAPSGWTVEHPATPEGCVALIGHEPVDATDGEVGRVDGVLADPHTGRVTHLLLKKGHLWGTREIQVPAGLIARYEDGRVALSVSKTAVGALPDVHA